MQNKDSGIESFNLVILPCKFPTYEAAFYYNCTYNFWHEHWQSTLSKVAGLNKLYSDDFIRQDEVICIFHKNTPISIMLHSYYDLSFPSHTENSFFKYFSKEVLEEIRGKGTSLVMTMGYLATDPAWRKNFFERPMAEVTISFSIKSFLSSAASQLVCFTRNDRKINQLVQKHGGLSMVQDLQVHNIASDIIRLNMTSAKIPDENVDFVEELWRRRIDFVPRTLQKQVLENFMSDKNINIDNKQQNWGDFYEKNISV